MEHNFYYYLQRDKKNFTVSVVCGAIVNFILNLILIYKFNSIGASIATVVAELVVAVVQLYYVRDVLKISDIMKQTKTIYLQL